MKAIYFKQFFLGASLMLACINVTKAAIIADWTFETSQPITAGPLAPEVQNGVGTDSALGSHAGAAAYSSPSGNGSTHSFSANTWAVGDYFQFQVDTVGYTGVTIQWDQTGSATGPKAFVLQFSTDGSLFTQVGSAYALSASTWNTATVMSGFTFTPDISAISGSVDNNSTVYFRLVDNSQATGGAINGGNVGTAGTDRVDNFIVSGNAAATVVPEPGEWGLISALGLLGMCGVSTWRRHYAIRRAALARL